MVCISIIIPSFNQAQFLERTLSSVLDQAVPVEVIVVDGGSTDGSVDILGRYRHRLAYWVSEPDRGQTHAINKGMARATGEIRAYLNSDDLLLPGALEAVVEAHAADPDADILHGRCITIDENDVPLTKRYFSDIETPADILDLWGVWFAGRNFVQPEVFWTRRIAERIGPFDESRHYVMDYDYWCRAILAGAKVHHIDRDIAAFRLWDQQKSTAAQKAADELRDVMIRHVEDPRTPISAALRRRLRGNWAFDEVYAKRGGALQQDGTSAIRRRTGMARAVLSRPELLYSPAFRRHAGKIVRNWLGA
ncbi:glycosyltransferase family 2 protein [Roseitranquillus sediminis]|uniref:glycosyltransferase family 2 protein n=1 Tax=Roseitranquillus sediminis TaxID=2809051 RepID=UPI001D0CC05A|nr:glycosyltransferase family 2 protein [Roseitranquillus sediminis]MBM9594006.1 glycosyltransferase [Roseitranquillus sediminis]